MRRIVVRIEGNNGIGGPKLTAISRSAVSSLITKKVRTSLAAMVIIKSEVMNIASSIVVVIVFAELGTEVPLSDAYNIMSLTAGKTGESLEN